MKTYFIKLWYALLNRPILFGFERTRPLDLREFDAKGQKALYAGITFRL